MEERRPLGSPPLAGSRASSSGSLSVWGDVAADVSIAESAAAKSTWKPEPDGVRSAFRPGESRNIKGRAERIVTAGWLW